MPASSSKTAPGQDLTQNGFFQAFPKRSFNRDLEGCQNAKIELQKGPWPGFGPKWPLPGISRRTLSIGTWRAAQKAPSHDLVQRDGFPVSNPYI